MVQFRDWVKAIYYGVASGVKNYVESKCKQCHRPCTVSGMLPTNEAFPPYLGYAGTAWPTLEPSILSFFPARLYRSKKQKQWWSMLFAETKVGKKVCLFKWANSRPCWYCESTCTRWHLQVGRLQNFKRADRRADTWPEQYVYVFGKKTECLKIIIIWAIYPHPY